METLRIAWLNQFDPLHPWAGGAERHIYEVSKRLVQLGHEVTIISERFDGSPGEELMDSVRIMRPGTRFGVHLWAATHFNKPNGCDIVVQDLSKILPWNPFGSWAVPSVAIVRHLNEAVLVGEVPFGGPVLWGIERSYGHLLRSAPVVTEANATAERLVKFGVARKSITLLRPGVDHTVFSPSTSERSPTPMVLYAGRLKRYKRVDLAIRALRYVRKNFPECRMAIVGDGIDSMRLRSLSERLGLSQHVEFLGKVSTEELVSEYRRSWLHVQPSSAEGWGYTVMEAAACGTPTAAFTGTALEESVGPYCQNYLAGSPSPRVLADAIERALADMASNSHEIAGKMVSYASNFDWQNCCDSFNTILHREAFNPLTPLTKPQTNPTVHSSS